MFRFFVRATGPATMEDVLNHIDHVAQPVGVEHAGIGTDVDLDGRGNSRVFPMRKSGLDGIDYSKKIYDLTEGLVRLVRIEPIKRTLYQTKHGPACIT
jgi:membrane dipeptidase